MSGKDNLKKLEKVLKKVLDCSADDLKDDNGPDQIVNWDSITHMELISKIEEEFDVEFDVDEINEIDKISSIKDALRKQQVVL
jgi:acyl carrier protein